MTVPGNIEALLLGGDTGYRIQRSLRFNSPDSASLSRTLGVSGNRRTFTFSMWVKTAVAGGFIFGAGNNLNTGEVVNSCEFGGGALQFRHDNQNQSTPTSVSTAAVFRDPSAWYHVIVAVNTTLATSTDRVKMYVNGVQQTTTGTFPSQNWDYVINSSSYTQRIGAGPSSGWGYYNGYMTEIHFVDGQQLTPSSFGETDTITGVWKPKRYAGTYGTNGFYLKFADNSGTTSTTLGKDSSGNGNNWTPNNFSVTAGSGNDSLIDTPTPYADGGNGRGNYATWNPLAKLGSPTTSQGNLEASLSASNLLNGSLVVSTGKWYYEAQFTSGTDAFIGWNRVDLQTGAGNTFQQPGSLLYFSSNGSRYKDGDGGASYGASYSTSDAIGCALDLVNNQVTWYKNNVSQGTISITAGNYAPCIVTGGTACNFLSIFGQRAFAYTPPSGFLALNTQNLPEPSIKKPSSYFDIKLYSGTNANQSITGLGFSPDLIWFKNRTGTAFHGWFDSVRGRAAGISSNVTDAESTSSAGNDLVSFDANGFSLGPVQNWNSTNGSGNSIVAWCWDESATPGFDIVTYTGNSTAGRTVSHSLGVTPSMIITKTTSTSLGNWGVYHSSLGATKVINLNKTDAASTSSLFWNNTAPSSTVFTVGTSNDVNGASNYVAYLWSEVAGFSKFGSYTGNGSTDGPFVFCGFRPRFILFKNTTNYNWQILDTARADYNQGTVTLFPNLSNAENTTATQYDILSNGFKIRTSDAGSNGSGNSIIFAAFAESPFKYSLAR